MLIAYRSRHVKEATGYRNLKFKRERCGVEMYIWKAWASERYWQP